MLRSAFRIVVGVVLVFGVISIWESLRTGHWLPSVFSGTPKSTHTVVLKEIQTLGKLELVRYNFKDVVEHEHLREWLPNPKAILIVQGEAVGCLDLTKMTTNDVASAADTLVVHLPDPELCSFKIDHANSRVYNTEFAFTEEAQLVQEAYQQAEAQVQKSAMDMHILEQTKRNAELILRPMIEKISGKKVLLRYRMKASINPPK